METTQLQKLRELRAVFTNIISGHGFLIRSLKRAKIDSTVATLNPEPLMVFLVKLMLTVAPVRPYYGDPFLQSLLTASKRLEKDVQAAGTIARGFLRMIGFRVYGYFLQHSLSPKP